MAKSLDDMSLRELRSLLAELENDKNVAGLANHVKYSDQAANLQELNSAIVVVKAKISVKEMGYDG